MKNLQEKIEKMLQGEKKRKEVAILFLETLTEKIAEVCMELYGENGYHKDEPSPAVWVWKVKEGKKVETNIYFRYGNHYGQEHTEGHGFYYSESFPYWGNAIQKEKGKDFWWAIRTIVEWLPLLGIEIEEKIRSRDALTEKLRQF